MECATREDAMKKEDCSCDDDESLLSSSVRCCVLTYLNNGLLTMNLQHLTRTLLTVLQGEVDDLGILWKLDVIQDDEWTLHGTDSRIV